MSKTSENTADDVTSRGTEIKELQQTYPDDAYNGQLKHTLTIDEKGAETVPVGDVLRDRLASEFPHDALYTHQAEGIAALKRGENVCAATSTSSGKTLIYALRVAQNKLDNPDSTALLVYPTKSLSRDQEQSLNDLYDELGIDISVNVYDGDTPGRRRKRIRNKSDVIITNFSGVNTYLNQHELWDSFYQNLNLVAIDESHSYTGIQGMHVAWTTRRLRRVANNYDANPQFVLTSATIGNPAEHSKQLTGVDVTVVDNDGSPHGERNIAFWRPPVQNADNENEEEIQRPADQEASEVLAHLTQRNKQTLMFTRSRKQTELNAQRARNAINDHPGTRNPTVESYNGGHGKQSRRSVENRLKSGKLDGVVTTNALELGIDIGSVDATILGGYPGTRQSFWQQLGRAGRGTRAALGVLVTRHDSIDQYILNNPEYLLDNDNIEDAVVDLENNFVFARHLLCASQELPLTRDDVQWFDPYRMESAVEMWQKAGMMVGTLDGGVQYDGPRRPQQTISMYATSDDQFEIRCEEKDVSLEPVGEERAYRDYHEGAIVTHKGDQYEVTELNEDGQQPYVKIKPVNVGYYTQAMSETTIENLNPDRSRELTDGVTLHWGTGTVTIQYDGYKKKSMNSNKAEPQIYGIDLPPIEMETQVTWVEINDDMIQNMKDEATTAEEQSHKEAVLGGLHGMKNGVISLAPLELRMDKQDLGGLSELHHPERDWNGGFFIYDGVSGGVGFARAIYEKFETIAGRVDETITTCTCTGLDGCPACIMESSCGSGNEPLNTVEANNISALLTK